MTLGDFCVTDICTQNFIPVIKELQMRKAYLFSIYYCISLTNYLLTVSMLVIFFKGLKYKCFLLGTSTEVEPTANCLFIKLPIMEIK